MLPTHSQFITYYNETKDKLFTYLMIRLNFDRLQAEDLLMDVVLKAYEHFDEFDPNKGSFKTWIFTLAHNHLVNFWRDNKKKKTLSLNDLEEKGLSPASAAKSESEAARSIEQQKIQNIMSLLTEGEREIITLRYMEDLSYGEIAQITNKKEGAIRTSLSRALARFAEFYEKIYP